MALRKLALPGAVLFTVGIGVMATMGQGTSLATIVAAHALMSIGVVMVNSPLNNHGLNSLDESVYAHGTSLMTTIQQVCGAGASALFIAIMTARSGSGSLGDIAAQAGGARAALQVATLTALTAVVMVPTATNRKNTTTPSGPQAQKSLTRTAI